MRLFFVFFVFSFISFSQTNQALINQAVQTAESQDIKTKSQAVNALEASGMTENQARALAKQRGLSYDQLLDQYFTDDTNLSKNKKDPNNLILEENSETQKEIIDEESDIKSESAGIRSVDGARYFGYEIFDNNPFLNKEYLLGNIDEGYLIAPGDEIRILTYGDNSMEQNVTVDRNGNINITNYGLFFASGMTFKTLKSRLKIFLGKYLSGLVSVPQKTFMDVSLTQLRPLKVVVLGQVNAPGPHILNTSGSALAALYAAGGVKTSGSLREIKIFRNGKLFKKIDLYDYITKGQLREDVRLTNNDIVFVDIRKNRFLLQGEVYNNAIYELKENEGLSELIKYSGGLPVTAQTTKVNISRITPAEERSKEIISDRELITFNYQESKDLNKKINLFDGDKITFFPILDLERNQVTISGHVSEPGMYSLGTYKDLKSLITNGAKGILPDVYFERVDVTSNVNGIITVNNYNLKDILEEKIYVSLRDQDEIIVYSNSRIEGLKTVSIEGYGVNNTKTSWKDSLSIYDIIFKNSEIKNPTFVNNLLQSRIDIKRYNNDDGTINTLKYKFTDLDELKNTFLKPSDRVILFGNSTTENINKSVGIYGLVKKGSTFNLEKNMYVEDLILLAGGFTNQAANQQEVIVNREEIDAKEERLIRRYYIQIDKDYLLGLKEKPDNLFELEDNDIVIVKQKEGYTGSQRIQITGEVVFPQIVVPEFRNTSFDEILNAAGGLTKYANLKASSLVRDGNIINLDLSKIDSNERLFRDGDVINIASSEGIVITTGELENPSRFIWKKGKRSKYYIRNSGGKIRKESSNSYLRKSNGISKKINLFKNPRVFPNDLIIVNKKIEKEKRERQKFDINQTIQFIASTLTTILLIEKL